jgi:hypothetical protein
LNSKNGGPIKVRAGPKRPPNSNRKLGKKPQRRPKRGLVKGPKGSSGGPRRGKEEKGEEEREEKVGIK